jgi:CrcB protein
MRLMLLAATGGALGAGARYLINVSMLTWFGAGFPWATFTVNVVGSFIMGVLAATLLPLATGSTSIWTFLATGILGGFTTFSAFSLDVWILYERHQHLALVLYVAGSVILSIAALFLGMALTRGILR